MADFFVATKNKGKIEEFKYILGERHRIITPYDSPLDVEVEEDGKTFEENALKKCNAYYEVLKIPVIADDSGLEAEALNGAPGVYSARFAGPNATDDDNNRKLLEQLQGLPASQRASKFVSVIALKNDKGSFVFRGECGGYIAFEPCGNNGFGYDPLFFIPSLGKTFAELNPSEKNSISHRAEALRKFKTFMSGNNCLP